jgi:hypothetical protein
MKQTNKSDLMLLFLAVMYENCIWITSTIIPIMCPSRKRFETDKYDNPTVQVN